MPATPTDTVPAAGCARPAMKRSSVVLPAPLSPSSAMRSGPRTVRLTGADYSGRSRSSVSAVTA